MNLLKSNLLYLSLIAFVFISTFAISLSIKKVSAQDVIESDLVIENKYFPPVPQLKDQVSTFPVFSAQAVLAQDLDSGIILYEKNADVSVLPASTTKIMTALVSMDYYNLDTVVTVTKPGVEGQKMGLEMGEKITVKDLLNGLLVYSANDAAEVLAQNYCPEKILSCGREAFVLAMNQKAKELGLTNTKFINPTGLDGTLHFSTARDLVNISSYAIKNPVFAQIVRTKDIVVESTDHKITHKLTNINELLGKVDGVLGVKTGWTENARENLVTYVDRGGRKVMIALLGSSDRFGESEELINWIFENYDWRDVVFSTDRNIRK